MAFKKHNWMVYSRHDKIIEITIKDENGKKLDFFMCNNKKDFPKIVAILRDKYDFDFKPAIKTEDSINFKKIVEEERILLDQEMDM